MPRLIKDAQVVHNPWIIVERDSSLEQALALEASHLLLPAELWLAQRQSFNSAGKTVAVWLDADQHPDMIGAHLTETPLVALHFPKFADGRAYSSAAVLKQHYGYQGEIRAIGDVLRDQLFYMKRCGFTSFDLADCVKLEDALAGFHDFADSYQSTIEQPQPLFRRRAL